MSNSKAILHLQQCHEQLKSALHWLQRSHQLCIQIDVSTPLNDDDLDKLENLTSRFARVTDILVNKMYRALDVVELMEPGSLIDTINRAEKKHLINSIEQARKLKDIRNEIVHEYVVEHLQKLFEEVLSETKTLIELSNKACAYSTQYLPK